MSQKYTIKDIAKLADVGTTTVSRVLNDHPYVSDEKRQRVLDAIDTLNYRQNLSAKWLRGSSTGLIGFLTDDVATTPYAVDIIRGAQDAALENDQVLLVVNTTKNKQSLQEAVEFLLERQVMGIIYAAMYHREVELPENIYHVPTTLANCYVADRSLPSAVPDEFIGGYRATRLLLENGHRRIAHISVVPPAIDALKGRLAGYRQALEEFNVDFNPQLIGQADDEDTKSNYAMTQRFLKLDNPPTAIACATDRTAIACYLAIMQAGLRIPEDISIVGYDNQADIATHLIPGLTTIQLPHYEIGRWAFHQLFEETDTPIQEKIDCALIRRDSVIPVRIT